MEMAKQNQCEFGNAELLLDYSAGRLDASQTIRLDRHVEECAHCRELLASQRLVWDALDVYQQATPAVSLDFDRQLYARIASEERESWWVRGWRRLMAAGEPMNWKPAMAGAAACVVLMAGVLVRLDGPFGGAAQPVTKAEVKSVSFDKQEIETIERALEDFEMLSAMGTPQEPSAPIVPEKL
jgi:anti-sigma factor RsiW